MKQLLETALQATIEASEEVLKQYINGFDVFIKEDKSPVTSADKSAHEIYMKYLSDSEFPILSEEGNHYDTETRNSWDKFWSIDPIDGTREFVEKTDEYCLSIGLTDKNTSYLGVLSAPSLNLLYFACEGIGSFKYNKDITELFNAEFNLEQIINDSVALPIKCQNEEYTFLTSRTHRNENDENYLNELEKKHKNLIVKKMGSAIKLGLVCEGYANEYSRLSYVNFWDLAGGHAIVKYSGLDFISLLTGKEPNYQDENMKVKTYSVKNK
ncbi:MAG: 3'(2'),5'-bisphosphate nucleotidase CysQ [Flavobacteriales bacterium]|nr:3'(2'),5'-bisphosphate nucleotidase CysQ [Flavobacteriales bacterium]